MAHGAIEDARGDAVCVLSEIEQFAVEAHLATRAQRFVGNDRLKHVLGDVAHRRGAGRLIVGLALDGIAPGQQAAQFLAGKTGGPDIVGHQLVRRGGGDDRGFNPRIAVNLDGALVGDMRPRAVGGPAIFVDQQAFDAIAR
ncbi:hypothetical protein D3C87_1302410 [compost metagenome]